MSLHEVALAAAGATGSAADRARRVIDWLNGNFEWTATDYQERTGAEILARRHGNCAEHARLLHALLQAVGIPARWMAEINLQPPNEQRQASAAEMVQRMGSRASVFGLMHNDHRWLEIDLGADGWFPADSTLGLFGMDAWVMARLGFGSRPPAGEEMLIPFTVVRLGPDRVPEADRSEEYLIRAFNQGYQGRLAALPAWPDWCGGVRVASPLGQAAFTGEANLHEHTEALEQLLAAYQVLKSQALAAGL